MLGKKTYNYKAHDDCSSNMIITDLAVPSTEI